MADLGFLPAVTRILDATPGRRPAAAVLRHPGPGRGPLVTAYLTDPALHAVAPQAEPASWPRTGVVLPAGTRWRSRRRSPARPARTLIFVRTKHGADRLARQLDPGRGRPPAIHGDLNQNQRAAGPGLVRRRATRGCWSPPTWPPAASTSTTSTWSCTSTRRTTTRTTCTGPAARPGRGDRARPHPGRGRPGARADADARRGRRRRAAAPRRRGPPPGPRDRHVRHAGTARPAEGPGRLAGGRGPRWREAAAAAAGRRPDRAGQRPIAGAPPQRPAPRSAPWRACRVGAGQPAAERVTGRRDGVLTVARTGD